MSLVSLSAEYSNSLNTEYYWALIPTWKSRLSCDMHSVTSLAVAFRTWTFTMASVYGWYQGLCISTWDCYLLKQIGIASPSKFINSMHWSPQRNRIRYSVRVIMGAEGVLSSCPDSLLSVDVLLSYQLYPLIYTITPPLKRGEGCSRSILVVSALITSLVWASLRGMVSVLMLWSGMERIAF